jgi:hypothetical protein
MRACGVRTFECSGGLLKVRDCTPSVASAKTGTSCEDNACFFSKGIGGRFGRGDWLCDGPWQGHRRARPFCRSRRFVGRSYGRFDNRCVLHVDRRRGLHGRARRRNDHDAGRGSVPRPDADAQERAGDHRNSSEREECFCAGRETRGRCRGRGRAKDCLKGCPNPFLGALGGARARATESTLSAQDGPR